ncbi:MAG: NAD-dependent protein deacylase [Candidatus Ornithomonoglobus sp.]
MSLAKLKEIIDKSNHIVFFGGAGVSTASGIPDFRGSRGIGGRAAEEILSHDYFTAHTEEFFDFYRKNMLFPKAKPNVTHYALAELERKGKLKAVITQNIDGLHRAAGSNTVLELHGNAHYNYCTKCGRKYGMEHIIDSSGIPRCECGGIVKPDVVLYGEPLDDYMVRMANAYAMAAEALIVGGTSLAVYPAKSILESYMRNRLVIINKTPTEFDRYADLVIRESIEDVFTAITSQPSA